ncbi:MAG: alpha/beta hydrolase [Aquihabitans sp.]
MRATVTGIGPMHGPGHPEKPLPEHLPSTTTANAPERPPVDPDLEPLLALLADTTVPMSSMSPDDARAVYRLLAAGDGEMVAGIATRDMTVPGPDGLVAIRVVAPEDGQVSGVVVWFHGGGWVIGDLDTAEATTRRLARAAGCMVVSVDYRLAPEHPAPAAFDDCWAVTEWVMAHRSDLGAADAPVAVGGDSAGGNLAALVALHAAGGGGLDLAAQLLVYPVTDLTLSFPSITGNGEGYFLTLDTMQWFTDHYLPPDADPADPALSPLHADLSGRDGLAPALIHVAGYDPLHDEGVAYADKLAAAGVSVEIEDFPTMIHGFYGMANLTPLADQAVEQAARFLRRTW